MRTPQSTCPAEVAHGDHLYVRVVSRPWRRLFRATYALRCWRCDVEVREP